MADLLIWSGSSIDRGHRTPTLPLEAQQYIKNVFWPYSKSSIAEYVEYFRYFQWTLSVLSWHYGASNEEQFAVQTLSDLAKVARCIELLADHSRASIAQELQAEFPSSSLAQILRSIDLTARLWLMVHVRSEDFPIGPLSDMTESSWVGSSSLKTFIDMIFPRISNSPPTNGNRIDPGFTVPNLCKICRIKVQWTANLRDHLHYDHTTATLYLFPHKICLISHFESCQALPKDLVSETIRTLDLLFPFGKESTQKYLDETSQSFHRTSSRNLSRATHFGEFQFWGKRLMELHEVFNEAPRSILQMWYDRRNPIQWWTFWLAAFIALLTVLFGVISSYTGFRQVVLAQKSYDLALSQACSQVNPPRFCER